MAIGGNYNPSYTVTTTGGYSGQVFIDGQTWTITQASSNNILFVIVCMQLGLTTPEERAAFKHWFDQIRPSWTPESVYDFLVERAYYVKFGNLPD